MDIALVAPHCRPAGGIRTIFTTAQLLRRFGHEACVVVYRSSKEAGSPSWCGYTAGLPIFYLPLSDLRRWQDVVPKVDVTLVHEDAPSSLLDALPTTAGDLYLWLMGFGTHNKPAEEQNLRNPRLKGVVAISNWLLEIAQQYAPKTRRALIHKGIDFSIFGPVPVKVSPDRGLVVGFVPHPAPSKGTQCAIQALTRLKPLLHAANCKVSVEAFCLSPPDSVLWRQVLQAYPTVLSISPLQSMIVAAYNRACLWMVPSISEGFGDVATEAMACGTAVITADNGGSRDYAFHKETAYVVPPNDPDALAHGVLELLRDDSLRQAIAERGQEFVQRFTWDESIRKLVTFFEGEDIE